jgi:hypothetical protein
MRVTFPRLPDHKRAYAVVERDDGVVYQLYGSDMVGPQLPHDIRHLVVERVLGITDGIWGAIADGVVFTSMEHVSGRRPPHGWERSRELLASFHQPGLRAEALANLVECVARLEHPSDLQILTLAATKLTVLPPTDAEVDPAEIAAAAQAMQVEAARWARLRVGEELSYDWPRAAVAARGRARARKPRIVRPHKKRKGRPPA